MGRIWALAGMVIAAASICGLLVGFVGLTTLLTMSLPIGAGVVGAYLGSEGFIGRGAWLFGGVLIGGLGFVLGAAAFPDTAVGLWLGAIVPVILIAFGTMWTRRESDFLAGMLGSGALTGVYATTFNLDPQSINVSLPIAIGQTVFPLGVGYLAGIAARLVVPPPPAEPEPEEPEAEPEPTGESPTSEALVGVSAGMTGSAAPSEPASPDTPDAGASSRGSDTETLQ